MTDTEFDDEAVADMADVWDTSIESMADAESPKVRHTSQLLGNIRRVCEAHDIGDTDDRIELAIAGVDRVFERQRTEVVSDVRELLEAMWGTL